MATAWNSRARDIVMQHMSPTLARRVCIVYNDCEVRSDDCSFNFLSVQYPKCDIFNAQQLSTSIAIIEMDYESSGRSNVDATSSSGICTNRGNESNGNINSDVNGAGSSNVDGSGRGNIGNGNRPQFSHVVPHA